MVARHARVIWLVAFVGQLRHVQVDNRDGAEVLRGQVFHHLLEMRKTLAIHRERPVVLLVVDVEPDHIRRNMIRAQMLCNVAHLRLRIVAVARLLEAQRPLGRQRRMSHQPRPLPQHLLRIWPVQNVVIQRPIRRRKAPRITLHFVELPACPPCVVQEKPGGAPFVEGQHKRD